MFLVAPFFFQKRIEHFPIKPWLATVATVATTVAPVVNTVATVATDKLEYALYRLIYLVATVATVFTTVPTAVATVVKIESKGPFGCPTATSTQHSKGRCAGINVTCMRPNRVLRQLE